MTSAPHPDSWIDELERSQVARTAIRATVSASVLIAAFFLAPLPSHLHPNEAPHVVLGLGVFIVVLVIELRQITKAKQPMLRATVAMATIIPLFLVIFAWIYLVMSAAGANAFGERLSRPSALYFAITVFSTVGFGDITAKTDQARMVVSVQMLADLAVIAVVVRLLFGAANRGLKRKVSETDDSDVTDEPAG